MLNNKSLMDEVIPLEFLLSQNYPNSFKEKTVYKYCVAYKTRVEIIVYDFEDKLVEKTVDEEMNAGAYEVEFSAPHSHESGDLNEEAYLYCSESGEYKSEKKIL